MPRDRDPPNHRRKWEAQEARRRFDEALDAKGTGPVNDQQLAEVLPKQFPEDDDLCYRLASCDTAQRHAAIGEALASLDTAHFTDAVEDVRHLRKVFGAHGGGVHLRRGPSQRPRTRTPAPDSRIASSQWRDYLAGHLDRVLADFAWPRDGARALLGLQPLTVSEEEARLDRLDPSDGVELRALTDPREAFVWLVDYIGEQPHPEFSHPEALLWRNAQGEDMKLLFPATCYPLRNLRDLARQVVWATGCRESEATEWLLADVRPEVPPTMAITSYSTLRQYDVSDYASPHIVHESFRYVIEVSSGLISPDDVAAFYRRTRNDGYAMSSEPAARQSVWTAELVGFVAVERRRNYPGVSPPTWGDLRTLWNERYPQHPFASVGAMQSSYRNAIRHAARDNGGK